jgi:hypothetical protein
MPRSKAKPMTRPPRPQRASAGWPTQLRRETGPVMRASSRASKRGAGYSSPRATGCGCSTVRPAR